VLQLPGLCAAAAAVRHPRRATHLQVRGLICCAVLYSAVTVLTADVSTVLLYYDLTLFLCEVSVTLSVVLLTRLIM
jgi:hypothetical protein